tara:strand:+ start:113 stop:547 length:435 start_codon:yes stop_codon:yes gene_type:complete
MKIVGGKWLKDRNRYDSEMCLANGWECIQGRHYDVLINNKKVEVKKTKSSSAIIKLQQLAEIVLQPELSDIFYLFIRTDKMQNSILDAIQIKALDLSKHVGMTPDMAEKIIYLHQSFKCTIQTSVVINDIKSHCNFESYNEVTK